MSIEAIVIQAGEGKILQMRGTEVAYKAEGERPGGGPTFLEFSEAPGFYTGDHGHTRVEEIFYVVEGELRVRVGDRIVRAKPGDFVLVPPGVPHCFGTPEGGPGKIVVLVSPAGVHDHYFEELAELLAKPTTCSGLRRSILTASPSASSGVAVRITDGCGFGPIPSSCLGPALACCEHVASSISGLIQELAADPGSCELAS